MNVIYVAQSRVPSSEANSVHVMRMCEALAECAPPVELWVPHVSESSESILSSYGVTIPFAIKGMLKRDKAGLAFLASLILALKRKKSQRSVVITRSLLGALAAVLTGHETTFEIHQPIVDYSALHERLFRWLLKRKKLLAVVVITHGLKRWYEARYPEVEGRLYVLPDAAALSVGDTAKPPAGFDHRAFNVAYAGSLLPGKGAEMIPLIARLLPDVTFHIFGGNGEQIAALEKQVPHTANVVFHGHVAHAEVGAKLKAMDVLLAPNQASVKSIGGKEIGQWTSPLKIFEYMAAGVPIIASDLAVLKEVLENGRNCLLCPADDVEAWAAAIKRLEHDAELGRALSRKAKAELIECYSWRVRARRMLEIAAPNGKK